MADFATYQSASLHGRIFTSLLPGSRTLAWWEKAENGMNHGPKIGSLSMSILVVDFVRVRFCSSCSAEQNGHFAQMMDVLGEREAPNDTRMYHITLFG